MMVRNDTEPAPLTRLRAAIVRSSMRQFSDDHLLDWLCLTGSLFQTTDQNMTETSLRLDQTQRSNILKQLLKSVVTTTYPLFTCLAILMQAHFENALPESKGYFTWICRFALETHLQIPLRGRTETSDLDLIDTQIPPQLSNDGTTDTAEPLQTWNYRHPRDAMPTDLISSVI